MPLSFIVEQRGTNRLLNIFFTALIKPFYMIVSFMNGDGSVNMASASNLVRRGDMTPSRISIHHIRPVQATRATDGGQTKEPVGLPDAVASFAVDAAYPHRLLLFIIHSSRLHELERGSNMVSAAAAIRVTRRIGLLTSGTRVSKSAETRVA